MSKDCWAKGGGKEGQNPHRKPKDKANAAKADNEFDAAWFIDEFEDDIEFDLDDSEPDSTDYCTADDDYADLPPLQNVPDSDDETEDDDSDEEMLREYEVIEKTSLTSDEIFAVVATTDPEYGLEIYDSGATQHFTPSRERLLNFQTIQTRGIVFCRQQEIPRDREG
jgi:hypothetical protein